MSQTDGMELAALNLEEFQQALADAPQEAYKFIRREHRRFGKRTYKSFIKERMSGPPGINWGGHGGKNTKKVGKNVLALQQDDGTLDSMRVRFKISSFLASHELGRTFTAKGGGNLAIPLSSTRTRDGRLPYKPLALQGLYGQRPFRVPNSNILAVSVQGKLIPLYSLHRSIRIPAKLGFRAFMRGQLGEFKRRTLEAAHQAMRVAIERRVKSIAGAVSSLSR